ncbi:hypothetical protein RCH11_001926 [Glaciihabitans sp. GrIS 2.15]|nr:hypothetical protein [Glaciihabitans sp. GrIS 2.15]
MLVPERTVDSLLAYELLRAFPRAILWSPTNTAGSLDHELDAGGPRAILFECKGIEDRWRIPIRAQQLDDYVTGGLGQLLYLLPSKPVDPLIPWLRSCASDPDVHGRCQACAASRGSDNRRWAGSQPPVSGAPPERRLQPWFNHWAWCVPAAQLQLHLGRPTRDMRIPAEDASLAAIPGAQRLCHMLPRSTASAVTGLPSGGGTAPASDAGGKGEPRGLDGGDEQPGGPLPGLAFSNSELRGEQIVAFWKKGTGDESRQVRPGSVGLLY